VLVLENYLTGRQSVLHPRLLGALGGLAEPAPAEQVAEQLGLPGGGDLVERLIRQDILLVEGTELAERDAAVAADWVWGRDAAYFHYSTRRTDFGYDLDTERAELLDYARLVPPPPPFKDYGRTDVELPAPAEQPADLWQALHGRRTGRRYDTAALDTQTLATLLHYTWAITDIRHDPGIGPVVLKTSPSGGARHPIETYPVIQNVAGVPAGVYHYCAGRHTLTLLGTHDASRLLRACGDQPWVADAAVVCFMSAVLGRSAWKYRQSHAYRVLLLDAGHLGQTFHLAATALGLSPWTSAALDETAVETLTGIDGTSEVALYCAAAGKTAR
jgi:SagB-type dehydrogenase family enzyme